MDRRDGSRSPSSPNDYLPNPDERMVLRLYASPRRQQLPSTSTGSKHPASVYRCQYQGHSGSFPSRNAGGNRLIWVQHLLWVYKLGLHREHWPERRSPSLPTARPAIHYLPGLHEECYNDLFCYWDRFSKFRLFKWRQKKSQRPSYLLAFNPAFNSCRS